jgi:uncharacterized protein (TIGR03067 family)
VRPLLVLAVLAAPLLAAPVPKALVKKATNIEGDWLWESQDNNGKVSPAPDSDFRLWRVAGDTMTLIQRQGTSKDEPCGLVCEPKGEGGLRSFEYKVRSNGYHRRGVCQVDGDTLRVAFGSNSDTPPADLKSGPNVSVYTFKRVTDTK